MKIIKKIIRFIVLTFILLLTISFFTSGDSAIGIMFILLFFIVLYSKKIIPIIKSLPKSIENLFSKTTPLNVVCFLIPIVGLVLYVTEKDKNLEKAESYGKSALWGVGVGVVSIIIIYIIFGIIISNLF